MAIRTDTESRHLAAAATPCERIPQMRRAVRWVVMATVCVLAARVLRDCRLALDCGAEEVLARSWGAGRLVTSIRVAGREASQGPSSDRTVDTPIVVYGVPGGVPCAISLEGA
jgi:hypothetical protein